MAAFSLACALLRRSYCQCHARLGFHTPSGQRVQPRQRGVRQGEIRVSLDRGFKEPLGVRPCRKHERNPLAISLGRNL